MQKYNNSSKINTISKMFYFLKYIKSIVFSLESKPIVLTLGIR